jgi:hypothetical protein
MIKSITCFIVTLFIYPVIFGICLLEFIKICICDTLSTQFKNPFVGPKAIHTIVGFCYEDTLTPTKKYLKDKWKNYNKK